MIVSSKRNALIEWVNALHVAEPIDTLKQLSDGKVLCKILHLIDTNQKYEWDSVEERFKMMLSALENHYQAPMNEAINTNMIIDHADELEIAKMCLLVLCMGALSESGTMHFAMNLDTNIQKEIMYMIEAVLKPHSKHVLHGFDIKFSEVFFKSSDVQSGTPTVASNLLYAFSPNMSSQTEACLSPLQQLVSSPAMSMKIELQRRDQRIKNLMKELNTTRHNLYDSEAELQRCYELQEKKEVTINDLQHQIKQMKKQLSLIEESQETAEEGEINALKQRIAELIRELNELRETVKHLEKNNRELTDENCLLREQLNKLQMISAECDQYKVKSSQLELYAADLEHSLHDRDHHIRTLTEINNSLEKDLRHTQELHKQQQLEWRQAMETSVQDESGECLSEVVEKQLYEQIALLQESLASEQGAKDRMNEHIKLLQESLANEQSFKDHMNEQIASLKSSLVDEQEQKGKWQKQAEDFKQELDVLQDRLKSLKQAAESEREKWSEMYDSLNQKLEEHKVVANQEKEELLKQVDALNKQLNALREENTSCLVIHKQEKDSLQQNIADIQLKLEHTKNNLEEHIAKLDCDVTGLREKNNSLLLDLSNERQAKSILEHELRELNSELDFVREKSETEKEQLKKCLNQLQEKEHDLEGQLEQQHEKYKEKLMDLQSKVKALQELNESLENGLADANKERSFLQELLAQEQTEQTMWRSKYIEMEQELISIKLNSETQIVQITGSLEVAQQKNKQLQQDACNFQKKVEQLENVLQSSKTKYEDAIKELQEKVTLAEDGQAKLEVALAEYREKNESLFANQQKYFERVMLMEKILKQCHEEASKQNEKHEEGLHAEKEKMAFLMEQNEELIKQANTGKSLHEKLESDLTLMKEELEKNKKFTKVLQASDEERSSQHRIEIEKVHQQKEKLQEQLVQVERSLTEMSDLKRRYQTEKSEMEEKLSSTQQELQHLQTCLHLTEKQLREREQHLCKQANQIMVSQEREQALEEEVSQLKNNLMVVMERQQKECNEQQEIIQDLEKQLQCARQSLLELERTSQLERDDQIKELLSVIREQEAKNKSAEFALKELRDQLDVTEKKEIDLCKQLKDSEERYDRLQYQLSVVTESSKAAEESFKEELDNLKKNQHDRLAELQADLQKAVSVKDNLEAELALSMKDKEQLVEENKHLNNTLQELNHKMTEMAKEIEVLGHVNQVSESKSTSEIERLQIDCSEKQKIIQDLEKQLQCARQSLLELERTSQLERDDQIKELLSVIREQEAKNKSAEFALKELHDQLDVTEKKEIDLCKQLKDSEERYDRLQYQLSVVTESSKAAEESFKEELDNLKKNQHDRLAELQADLQKAVSVKDNLEAELALSMKDKEQLVEENKHLNNTLQELNHKMTEMAKEIEVLGHVNQVSESKSTSEIERLQIDCSEKQKITQDLEKQLQCARQSLLELEQTFQLERDDQIKELLSVIREQEAKNKSAEFALKELRDQLDVTEKKEIDLCKQLKDSEERYDRLQYQLSVVTESSKAAEESFKEELDNLKKNQHDRLAELQADLQKAVSVKDNLEAELALSMKDKEQLVEENKHLNNTLQELNHKMTEMAKEIEVLGHVNQVSESKSTSEIERLQIDCSEKQKITQDLEKQLQCARQSLLELEQTFQLERDDQIRELLSVIREQEAKNKSAEFALKELRDQLDVTEKKESDLCKQLKDSEERYDRLQYQLSVVTESSKTAEESFKEELDNLKKNQHDRLAELQADLQKAVSVKDNLEAELALSMKDKEQLVEENKHLNNVIIELNEKLAEKVKRIEELEGLLQEQRMLMIQLDGRNKEHQCEMYENEKKLQNSLSELQDGQQVEMEKFLSQKQILEERVTKAEDELSTLLDDYKAALQRTDALVSELCKEKQSHAKTRSHLQEELAIARQSRETALTQLEQLKAEYGQVMLDLEQEVRDKEALQVKLCHSERQLRQLQENMKVLEKFTQMEEEHKELKKEVNQLNSKLMEQNKEFRKLLDRQMEKCSEWQHKYEKMAELKKQYELDAAKFKEAAQSFRQQCESKSEQLMMMEQKLDAYKDEIHVVDKKFREANVEVSSLSRQLKEQQASHKKMASQIRSLEAQLELASSQLRCKDKALREGQVTAGRRTTTFEVNEIIEDVVPGRPLHMDELESPESSRDKTSFKANLTRNKYAGSNFSLASSNSSLVANDDTNITGHRYATRSRTSIIGLTSCYQNQHESYNNQDQFQPVKEQLGETFKRTFGIAEDEPDMFEFGRLSELRRRNTLCLPHMKTSYPVETQTMDVPEDNLKAFDNLSDVPDKKKRMARKRPSDVMTPTDDGPAAMTSKQAKDQSSDDSLNGSCGKRKIRDHVVELSTPGVKLYKRYSPKRSYLRQHSFLDENQPLGSYQRPGPPTPGVTPAKATPTRQRNRNYSSPVVSTKKKRRSVRHFPTLKKKTKQSEIDEVQRKTANLSLAFNIGFTPKKHGSLAKKKVKDTNIKMKPLQDCNREPTKL